MATKATKKSKKADNRGRTAQRVKELNNVKIQDAIRALRKRGYFPKNMLRAFQRAGYSVALATIYQAAARAAGGKMESDKPIPKIPASAIQRFMTGIPTGRSNAGKPKAQKPKARKRAKRAKRN